jgi:hypothetical protein
MKINISDFSFDRFRINPYLPVRPIRTAMLLHRFIPQSRHGLETEVPMAWRRVIASGSKGKCQATMERGDSADCPSHPRSRIRPMAA